MNHANKMLLDEYPLIVLPKLAVNVGLNEAIVLQQINYWLQKSDKIKDGKKWTYGSYEYWGEQFPFWSTSTTRRALTSLEKQNLIETANYNKAGFDKTKWYTINYEELESMSRRCVQNEQTSCSKRADGVSKMSRPIPETSSKTSSKTSSTKDILSGKAELRIPFKEIVDYLNEKTGSRYKDTSKKTQSLIRARFNDGFTLDDFKKVIDIKTDEWKDTDMSKFLRPETLFGTKFESYLNQKQVTKGGYDGPTRYDELF